MIIKNYFYDQVVVNERALRQINAKRLYTELLCFYRKKQN